MRLISKKFFRRKKAYTLVEILIVISIIAILATIIIISFINAQAKSRDSKRRADVRTIANALQAYHLGSKIWFIPGTGQHGEGYGWFNYENPADNYPKSIAHGLEEGKFLISAPRDPKMTNDTDATDYFQYMVYPCHNGEIVNGISVSARLEFPTAQEISDIHNTTGTNSGCDSWYIDDYNRNFRVVLR